jgi:F-type H+-transporting ATPase subunit delta
MRGASRDSLASGRDRLEALLDTKGTKPASLGEDLLGITGVLAHSAGLRRALTDPSRSAESKARLVQQIFGGKVSDGAVDLVAGLAGSRWSVAGDLTDAVEMLGVDAVLAKAENAGHLDAVEDELFRFSRVVAADVGLRDAFSTRSEGSERKAELVQHLLGEKATPETVRLATQAAVAPRGLRTEQVLENFVEAAAYRRQQLVAEVISAVPLTTRQRERLGAALRRIYGRPIRLNTDVDPGVVGGLRVQLGGEVIDGTVLARLDDARRRMAG